MKTRYFQDKFGAIVTRAPINPLVLGWHIFSLSDKYIKGRMIELYSNWRLSWTNGLQIAFQKGCAIPHCFQQLRRLLVFLLVTSTVTVVFLVFNHTNMGSHCDAICIDYGKGIFTFIICSHLLWWNVHSNHLPILLAYLDHFRRLLCTVDTKCPWRMCLAHWFHCFVAFLL